MTGGGRIFQTIIMGALASLLLAPSAQAHQRTVSEVYGLDYPHDNKIGATAILNRGHDGTMKLTLVKKVAGDWKFVARKGAQPATEHNVTWNTFFHLQVPGDRTCQIRAKFTAPIHEPARNRSAPFGC